MNRSQLRPSEATSLSTATRAAGFRRIEQVRVVTGGGRTAAEVTGVLHRYPRTVPVSIATAMRLARAGAPLRIETDGRTGASA